jgi:hypothetical protein
LYLKPLIEKNEKLEAFRSEPLRGNIASQIITDLVNADVVVADLTDFNPNVLWELGVRQSFKHCTITIAEANTQIPFHFSHKGILFYNGEHLDNETFEERFTASLKNCLEQPNEPDSPVLETLGGRGTLYSIIHAEENARRIEALRHEITYNKDELERIQNLCKENKEKRAKKESTSVHSKLLKVPAVEFLRVNRYLDLEQGFYDLLSDYCTQVSAINARLIDWITFPEKTEAWLLRNIKAPIAKIVKLLEKLEHIQ